MSFDSDLFTLGESLLFFRLVCNDFCYLLVLLKFFLVSYVFICLLSLMSLLIFLMSLVSISREIYLCV